MSAQPIRHEVPSAFLSLYRPNRYKVRHGGRGGAKSWQFADALLIQGAEKKLLIGCAREIQKSIKDSVHRLLANRIQDLGLGYTVQDQRIFNDIGTEFIFLGLKNNVAEVKSLEGADRFWVEEAQTVSEFSWDVVLPTIRKPGSEIWVSFNPFDELDDTYQRFVVNPPPGADVRKVTYRDNPWFPGELRAEMERMKLEDYQKYLWVWEGECNGNYEDAIVKPEWFNAAVDAHNVLGFDPVGLKRAGYDVADEGEDAKALTLAHGSVITSIESWDNGDVYDATSLVFDKAMGFDADVLTYDAVGVGTAVKVQLKDRIGVKKLEVTPFSGGETPRDPKDVPYEDGRTNRDVFKNLRAQFVWRMRERFERTYRAVEKGVYTDPADMVSICSDIPHLSEIRAELCRVQRKRGNNNFIQIESKKDMRARGVPSPNRFDSTYMAFANLPHSGQRRRPKQYPRLAIA